MNFAGTFETLQQLLVASWECHVSQTSPHKPRKPNQSRSCARVAVPGGTHLDTVRAPSLSSFSLCFEWRHEKKSPCGKVQNLPQNLLLGPKKYWGHLGNRMSTKPAHAKHESSTKPQLAVLLVAGPGHTHLHAAPERNQTHGRNFTT